MEKQRGFAHILLLLLIVAILIAAGYFLVTKGFIKLPGNLSQITKKQAASEVKVAVKTEYDNPFDKKSQYVNPFDQYKSPFLNLKK